MDVDFGRVRKYFADKGFGFVSQTFASTGKGQIFFHIKTIKRLDPEAARLFEQEDQASSVYFWYKIAQTSKGEQVTEALDASDIAEQEVLSFTKMIRGAYENITSPLSDEIKRAAQELLSKKSLSALTKKRSNLESEQNEMEERRRHEETSKHKEIIDKLAIQQKIEQEEFRGLVTEILSHGFKQSKQVSEYIVAHKLGYKYPNISGMLEMEMDGRTWSFNGGFPPKVYARLCEELGLSNQGTRARRGLFTPYKDILLR